MMMRLLISIGAGLAAAIFFIVPMKGSMAAGVTMLFAPLPLMVAGLAFAPSSALYGAIAGALLIFGIIHEYYAVFFVAWAGIPAWWLTRIAWLARPANEGEEHVDGLLWYPLGGLAFSAALLGAGVAAGLVLFSTLYFGSYENFHGQMSKALLELLEAAFKAQGAPRLPEDVTPQDVARYASFAMPPVLAGWAALSYAVNLWIAGRITHLSGATKRPWVALPEHLRMPSTATAVMMAAFLICILEGLPRALALIVMAALGTLFAVQGFAVLHAMSRGFQWRSSILLPLYLTTFFFFPAPAVLAAVFGLAHALSTRGRAGSNNATIPKS